MKNPLPRRRQVTTREAEQARARVRALETAYDGIAGPTPAARLAEAREHAAGLEARLAEQERGAAADAIRPELDAARARLTDSRDRVAGAARDHAAALARLLEAAEAHNAEIATARTLLAGRGLTARRDDAEGCTGNPFDGLGARIDGTDFTPVPAEQVAAHTARLLCGRAYGRASLLARLLASACGPGLETRPDGLRMPPVPPGFALKAPEPEPWPVTAGRTR